MADLFGVCEATVHTIVHRISSIICSDLLPALVKWPSGMKVQETVDKDDTTEKNSFLFKTLWRI
jgi:hypothetical protein